jgi:hypothetical protein
MAKKKKMTFAQVAEELGNKIAKIESQIVKGDRISEKSGELEIAKYQKKLDALFEEQEAQKAASAEKDAAKFMKKYGGNIGAEAIHRTMQSTTDHQDTSIDIEKKGKRNLQQNFGASPAYFMHGGLIPNSPVGSTNLMPSKGSSPEYMGAFNPSYAQGPFKRFMFGGLIPGSPVGSTNNMPAKGSAPAYMGAFSPSYAQGPFKRFAQGGMIPTGENAQIQPNPGARAGADYNMPSSHSDLRYLFGGLIPSSPVGGTNNMPAKGSAPSYMSGFNPSYMTGPFKRFEKGGNTNDDLLGEINEIYNFKDGGLPKYTNGRPASGSNFGPPMTPASAQIGTALGMYPDSDTPISDMATSGPLGLNAQRKYGKPELGAAFIPEATIDNPDLAGGPQFNFTPGTEKTKNTPSWYWNQGNKQNFWEKAGNFAEEALPYLPAAYNLGMGLFGQVEPFREVRNPYEERAMSMMGNRRFQAGSQYEGNKRMFNAMRRQARNLGQSPGSYFNRLSSAAYNKRQQDLRIAELENRMNNQYRGEEARLAASLGAQRAARKQQAQAMTAQAEANQAQYLPKALEQFSAIGQAKGRDKRLLGMTEDFYSNMKYNKATGKWDYNPGAATASVGFE